MRTVLVGLRLGGVYSGSGPAPSPSGPIPSLGGPGGRGAGGPSLRLQPGDPSGSQPAAPVPPAPLAAQGAPRAPRSLWPAAVQARKPGARGRLPARPRHRVSGLRGPLGGTSPTLLLSAGGLRLAKSRGWAPVPPTRQARSCAPRIQSTPPSPPPPQDPKHRFSTV